VIINSRACALFEISEREGAGEKNEPNAEPHSRTHAAIKKNVYRLRFLACNLRDGYPAAGSTNYYFIYVQNAAPIFVSAREFY
jgi:hypothetical protein